MEHQINWFNLLVGGVTDKVEEEVAEIVEINEEKNSIRRRGRRRRGRSIERIREIIHLECLLMMFY